MMSNEEQQRIGEEEGMKHRYPPFQRWHSEEPLASLDDDEEDELLTALLGPPSHAQEEEEEEGDPSPMYFLPLDLVISWFKTHVSSFLSPPPPPPPLPPPSCPSCERSHQQIDILAEQLARTRVEKHHSDYEYAITLSLVARLAQAIGFSVGLALDVRAEEEGQAGEVCLFLRLPSGQVCWQLPDEALPFFDDVPIYPEVISRGEDTSHATTAQKWERVLHPHLSYPTPPTAAPHDGSNDTTTTAKRRVVRRRHVARREEETS